MFRTDPHLKAAERSSRDFVIHRKRDRRRQQAQEWKQGDEKASFSAVKTLPKNVQELTFFGQSSSVRDTEASLNRKDQKLNILESLKNIFQAPCWHLFCFIRFCLL
jgi:hypothetical protein